MDGKSVAGWRKLKMVAGKKRRKKGRKEAVISTTYDSVLRGNLDIKLVLSNSSRI